jgi:HSP20 family protein
LEDENNKEKKKRKRWWEDDEPFDEFDDLSEFMRKFAENIMNFPDLNEMIENMFKQLNLNKDDFLSRKEPLVWGFSMATGPDNKPIIRKFGNVSPEKEGPKVKGAREPLVDIIVEDEKIVVVAEMPGIEKNNINLNATEDYLIISADTEDRKYYKKINFENKINPKSSKAAYKNGVLEISFIKK